MGGHDGLKPTKYHTIDDIPDELIPTYSKRDPHNQIYKTRRWVNFKKKQILFAQRDGVPNYLRTRNLRVWHYLAWTSAIGLLFVNIYKFNQYNSKK